MINKHGATLSALNSSLREIDPTIDRPGANGGKVTQAAARNRKKARRRTNEEVAANAIGGGNIATFDPLLAARPIDPRLQRMLDSLDGPETAAKKAVRERVIMAWNRLHGARAMATDQGTSGDA